MNNIIMTIILGAIISTTAMAQSVESKSNQAFNKEKTASERPQAKQRMEELTTRLQLTGQQTEQIKVINQKFRAKFDAAKKDLKNDPAERMEVLKPLHMQRDEAIRNILTAEQIAEYNEIIVERKAKKKEKHEEKKAY